MRRRSLPAAALLLLAAAASFTSGVAQSSSAAADAAERLAGENQLAWVQKLCALMAIPSVSSDPARRKDVVEAADRTAGLMTEVGLHTTTSTNALNPRSRKSPRL
jgi:hypothetical protein